MSDLTDLEAWDNVGDWLLRWGIWEDDGVWSDASVWIDEGDTWTLRADNATVWGEA